MKLADPNCTTLTDVGVTVQAAPAGSPLHVRFTVPKNPSVLKTARLYVAVCPAFTVAADPEESEKSVRVPFTIIVFGFPLGKLPVIPMPVVYGPGAGGWKVTVTWQD